MTYYSSELVTSLVVDQHDMFESSGLAVKDCAIVLDVITTGGPW